MGKKRLIAETGAGQHGTATAMVAALMGMECTIYMGAPASAPTWSAWSSWARLSHP